MGSRLFVGGGTETSSCRFSSDNYSRCFRPAPVSVYDLSALFWPTDAAFCSENSLKNVNFSRGTLLDLFGSAPRMHLTKLHSFF